MKTNIPNIPNDDQDNDVVFLDESNCVVDRTRRPLRQAIRKAILERTEKQKKLLELKEKMYGKPDDGKNGDQPDSDVKRIG